MTTTLYLVRHAEAEGNWKRTFQGHIDSEVSEKGWTQLDYLARRFEQVRLDAVYSSPLKRAWATAEAINRFAGLPITPERGNAMRKYGGLCRCPTRFSTKPRKRAGTGSPPTCRKRMRGWRSKSSRLSKGEGACRGKRRSACARYGFLGKRLGDVPSERVGESHAGGWVALRRSKICTVEPLR